MYPFPCMSLLCSSNRDKVKEIELKEGLIAELKQQPLYYPSMITYPIWIVMSCLLLVYVYTQPWAYRRTPDGIGLAPFPTFFLICMLVLSLLCFWDTYKDFKAKKEILKGDEDLDHLDKVWIPMVLVCIVSILSAFLTTSIDPLINSAVYAVLVLICGDIYKWYLLLAIAVGEMIFHYIFILRIADVYFPVSWFW